MAKIRLRVPTLDEVPAERHADYRPLEGGGFILDHEDDPDGFGIDNLTALRGKVEEAARDRQRASARLQEFARPDGSLPTGDEYRAMVAQFEQQAATIARLQDPAAAAQRDAEVEARARKPLEAQLAKAEAAAAGYRERCLTHERDAVVGRVLDLLRPLPEWRAMLQREVTAHVEVQEDSATGALRHVVLDPATRQPRASQTKPGSPMQGEEFARDPEFRRRFGMCLQGDGKKGADLGELHQGGRNMHDRDVVLTQEQARDINVYGDAKRRAAQLGGAVRILAPADAGAHS